MLISNNVFCTKGFLVNLANISIHISSCGVDITINTKHRSEFLKQKILAYTTTFIPPICKVLVFFRQIFLPNICNFFFHPSFQQQLMLYSHFLIHTSCKVLVQNDADYPIQIPRNHRLDYMIEVSYKNCLAILIDYDIFALLFNWLFLLFHKHNGIKILPANTRLEIELLNGIKIYGDSEAI